MKTLFMLWMLINAGFVNANRWPSTYVGPMPVCEKLELNGGNPRCAGKPAYQVFLAWLEPESQTYAVASDASEDGEPISNGF